MTPRERLEQLCVTADMLGVRNSDHGSFRKWWVYAQRMVPALDDKEISRWIQQIQYLIDRRRQRAQP